MSQFPGFNTFAGHMSGIASLHAIREHARRAHIADTINGSIERGNRTWSRVEKKRELLRLLRARAGR